MYSTGFAYLVSWKTSVEFIFVVLSGAKQLTFIR